MKNLNIKWFCALSGLILAFSSCKKESQNIFNMFEDVKVTFHGDNPLSVTDYKEVNDGDSVYIDYTITSANKDMTAVCVLKVGDGRPTEQVTIPEGADKRTYSGVFKMKADRVGKSSYRVYAINDKAVYMGDGYKMVTIDVKPDFSFFTNRRVYLPDTVTQTAACYYSISKGESFSYTDGAAVSSELDFGIYRVPDTDPNGTPDAINGYLYYIYALTADPLPFTPYNISSWAKTETLFSNVANDARNFDSKYYSGSAIESTAKGKKANLKVLSKPLKVGYIVYFMTQQGKYGALRINQISSDYDGKYYMSFDIKTQL